jgi:transposase InsO family protein
VEVHEVGWEEVVQQMSFRKELMLLASGPDANVGEICRRFKVSRKTFYKWQKRWILNGETGLKNQSKRPKGSPLQTEGRIEEHVVAVRKKHPSWGGRKIRRRLQDLGHDDVPAASTIHAILKRHDLIDPAESVKHQAWQRFEHEAPNQLWQMDFKGWFQTDDRQRCHPLTILDDHSRYVVCLRGCANQQTETVRHYLVETFRRYGLPERMTMDNGAPWGNDLEHRHTPLTAWLMRMGVGVSHSRPYHPQTQGKDERFHRTLDVDLLQSRNFRNLADVQTAFDPYRHIYNHQRPHQAIGMAVPSSRYRISPRSFPETLPAIEYDSIDIIRKVAAKGHIQFRRHTIAVGKAFYGYPIAIRPTPQDAVFHIYFCRFKIRQFDLRNLA